MQTCLHQWTRCREWTQARGINPPEYQTINESGPDHEKVFSVEVKVEDLASGVGEGYSKREASKIAAKKALDKISKMNQFKKNIT